MSGSWPEWFVLGGHREPSPWKSLCCGEIGKQKFEVGGELDRVVHTMREPGGTRSSLD